MIGIILNYRDAKVHYFTIKDESDAESEIMEMAEKLQLHDQEYLWMAPEKLDIRCEDD